MGNSPTHAQRGVPSHEPYRTSDIDVDKEITRLKSILEKNPDNGQHHENIGHLYMQKVIEKYPSIYIQRICMIQQNNIS